MIRIPSAVEYDGDHSRPGIVLLHSFTGSSRDMKFLAPALNAAGYGVYVPILRGHHDRTVAGPLLGGNPDDWWQDVQAAVTRMRRTYPSVAVFGLSLGGVLAMRAIAELPDVVAGGVMAAPIWQGSPYFTRTVHGYFDYVQYYTGVKADKAALAPAIEEQRGAIRHLAHGVMRDAPTVTKPVFIAQGGKDSVINPETARQTQTHLQNAPTDFHWYPDADHILTVDPAHKQLEADMIAFLNRLA